MTKIKLCGLYRKEDIELINQYQVDYVGFILNYTKSHRYIETHKFQELIGNLKEGIGRVGVFVNPTEEELFRVKDELDVIQLHGDEKESYIDRIKDLFPDKEIWKAYKIDSNVDLEKAKVSHAHKILLDNGYGTGKTFDWRLLNEPLNRTFILAGGLAPENVKKAVEQFKPWCVDLSSGVEVEKKKDRKKIEKILQQIKGV